MTIHLATDHAGFPLKEVVKTYLTTEVGYEVVDHGAMTVDESDDYPDFVRPAAAAVAANPETERAILFGGSGQGEAMAANRFTGVRATVFYGEPAGTQTDSDGHTQSIISASREHNNANVLSIGARLVSEEAAKAAILAWLSTDFSGAERHQRRLRKLDEPYESATS